MTKYEQVIWVFLTTCLVILVPVMVLQLMKL